MSGEKYQEYYDNDFLAKFREGDGGRKMQIDEIKPETVYLPAKDATGRYPAGELLSAPTPTSGNVSAGIAANNAAAAAQSRGQGYAGNSSKSTSYGGRGQGQAGSRR